MSVVFLTTKYCSVCSLSLALQPQHSLPRLLYNATDFSSV